MNRFKLYMVLVYIGLYRFMQVHATILRVHAPTRLRVYAFTRLRVLELQDLVVILHVLRHGAIRNRRVDVGDQTSNLDLHLGHAGERLL